jgi:hypothetical protein
MENRTAARSLATQALNDLSAPGVPLEKVIRTAIRVSALCNHPAMRAWLQLQIMDLSNASTDRILLKEAIAQSIGDKERAKRVTETVLIDYLKSRDTPSEPGNVYSASIDSLERLAANFGNEIHSSPGPVPQDFLLRYNEMRRMVLQIKNRVEEYLVGIESEGGTSSLDGDGQTSQ